jgi:hypothetical protein
MCEHNIGCRSGVSVTAARRVVARLFANGRLGKVRPSLIGRNLSLGCRRAAGARETVSLGPGCLSLLIFSR